ncbi:MAG TPA: sugar O-acetyltransferase [Arachidicoccus sp.]|nr:sugar O-acetyltransferase [Arachidicoccus sp.]
MTEKEKMIAGAPYRADAPELVRERDFAKDLLFDLQKLRPSQVAKRVEGLKKLIGKYGHSFYFEFPFYCDYGYNIEIGDQFYANHNLIILDCAKVVIGHRAYIGPNVAIYTAGHPIHYERRNEGLEFALPIHIGDNVWIGGNVVINPGIRIGDNVVIGAGSIVTKDIPDNCVAVGNPCRVQREVNEADKKMYRPGYPANFNV